MSFDLARLVPGARVMLPDSDEQVRLLTVTAGPLTTCCMKGRVG